MALRRKITLSVVVALLLISCDLFGQTGVSNSFYNSDSSRNIMNGVFRTGKQDTIHSFVGNIPIYTLIIKQGVIQKLTVHHPMKSYVKYDEKGNLSWMELSDTNLFDSLTVVFRFWNNGRLIGGNSFFNGSIHGTQFDYTHSGVMKVCFEMDMGLVQGISWTLDRKGKYYLVETYRDGWKDGPVYALSRKKNKVLWRSRYIDGKIE